MFWRVLSDVDGGLLQNEATQLDVFERETRSVLQFAGNEKVCRSGDGSLSNTKKAG